MDYLTLGFWLIIMSSTIIGAALGYLLRGVQLDGRQHRKTRSIVIANADSLHQDMAYLHDLLTLNSHGEPLKMNIPAVLDAVEGQKI